MKLFIVSHESNWLNQSCVPMAITSRRMERMRGPTRARGEWILDSGSRSILRNFRRHPMSASAYARNAQWYGQSVEKLVHATVQDWPADEATLKATGHTLLSHQSWTVRSFKDLRRLASDVPWMPVLVGVTVGDYLHHIDLYRDAGADLASMPLVAVRGAFQRENPSETVEILEAIAGVGVKTHALWAQGVPFDRIAPWVVSADSAEWSAEASQVEPLPQCGHWKCTHCLRFAEAWHGRKVLEIVSRVAQ